MGWKIIFAPQALEELEQMKDFWHSARREPQLLQSPFPI